MSDVSSTLPKRTFNSLTKVWKDADDYHNRAIEIYRQRGAEGQSESIVEIRKGLQLYPYDIDLLADAVRWSPIGVPDEWLIDNLPEKFNKMLEQYPSITDDAKKTISESINGQDSEKGDELVFSEDFLFMLCTRLPYWNWRAYDFSIDYLVDKRAKACQRLKDAEETLKMAENLANLFTETQLDTDRACSAKAKVLLERRQADQAKEYLQNEIENASCPMPSSCLRLTDLYMDSGQFKEAIEIADKGIKSTAQTQPSVSLGYFFYCKAIASEALYREGGEDYKLNDVIRQYHICRDLRVNATYKDNIEERIRGLKEPSDDVAQQRSGFSQDANHGDSESIITLSQEELMALLDYFSQEDHKAIQGD